MICIAGGDCLENTELTSVSMKDIPCYIPLARKYVTKLADMTTRKEVCQWPKFDTVVELKTIEVTVSCIPAYKPTYFPPLFPGHKVEGRWESVTTSAFEPHTESTPWNVYKRTVFTLCPVRSGTVLVPPTPAWVTLGGPYNDQTFVQIDPPDRVALVGTSITIKIKQTQAPVGSITYPDHFKEFTIILNHNCQDDL